jgi:phosphoglycerate kinase
MASHLPVLEDLPDPAGRAVLVRADLNVPLGPKGEMDDFRLRASVPTLVWLAEHGARLTVCSHLGRPGGKPVPRLAMAPVAERLRRLLAAEIGDEAADEVRVMENLRFDPGEEANDPAFVDRLVEGQQLYVNDAFGSAHRAHASVVGPPARLPSAAGRLLAREAEVLTGLLDGATRPFVAVLGGAKVSGKLGLVGALLAKAEVVMVGGGMCFTFLAALGHDVGDSLVEPGQVDNCRKLLDSGRRIMVPTDIVALEPGSGEVKVVGRSVPAGWKGMDIGPDTAGEFADELSEAGTVFWNGPMGVFEDKRFSTGTAAVARAVAECHGFTVVGGGDSAAALASLGLDGAVDHLSTGGGASLELLEKGDLPGLAILRQSWERQEGHEHG